MSAWGKTGFNYQEVDATQSAVAVSRAQQRVGGQRAAGRGGGGALDHPGRHGAEHVRFEVVLEGVQEDQTPSELHVLVDATRARAPRR